MCGDGMSVLWLASTFMGYIGAIRTFVLHVACPYVLNAWAGEGRHPAAVPALIAAVRCCHYDEN